MQCWMTFSQISTMKMELGAQLKPSGLPRTPGPAVPALLKPSGPPMIPGPLMLIPMNLPSDETRIKNHGQAMASERRHSCQPQLDSVLPPKKEA
jgi:hypothetical protein